MYVFSKASSLNELTAFHFFDPGNLPKKKPREIPEELHKRGKKRKKTQTNYKKRNSKGRSKFIETEEKESKQ